MALPQLNTPTYEMVQPSTGETIKFRPFLVKEQKILMIAQETGEGIEMSNAMCELIKSCTFGKISEPEHLPSFDIEYMFLKIRSKSVGEEVELTITCTDDNKTEVPYTLNLNDVEIQRTEGHNNVIMITDKVGMTMSYPSLNHLKKYTTDNLGAVEVTFGVIAECLVNIFDENEVYEELPKKELDEFIESMNTDQFASVQAFFDGIPRLRHDIVVTNPNTGKENKIRLEGLQSFLG
jgi:hypothetical protein